MVMNVRMLSGAAFTGFLALSLTLVGVGCASTSPSKTDLSHATVASSVRGLPLLDVVDGQSQSVDALVRKAPFTVMTFFSRTCPCQEAHDERIRALASKYAPRGVQILVVDSEVDASPENDAAEAKKRDYRFPMLIDREARLARALDAEYATYTVIFDRDGQVRYRGGIDSDRTHLRSDADHYVREALDDLLAGRTPHRPEAKALGCALRTS